MKVPFKCPDCKVSGTASIPSPKLGEVEFKRCECKSCGSAFMFWSKIKVGFERPPEFKKEST